MVQSCSSRRAKILTDLWARSFPFRATQSSISRWAWVCRACVAACDILSPSWLGGFSQSTPTPVVYDENFLLDDGDVADRHAGVLETLGPDQRSGFALGAPDFTLHLPEQVFEVLGLDVPEHDMGLVQGRRVRHLLHGLEVVEPQDTMDEELGSHIVDDSFHGFPLYEDCPAVGVALVPAKDEHLLLHLGWKLVESGAGIEDVMLGRDVETALVIFREDQEAAHDLLVLVHHRSSGDRPAMMRLEIFFITSLAPSSSSSMG